ncbi:MAG: iron(III) transport system substrate-binding protein [Parasphingorhabdus sp.]
MSSFRAIFAALYFFTFNAFASNMPASTVAILENLDLNPDILKNLDAELAVPVSWIEGSKQEEALRISYVIAEKHFEKMVAPFRERYPSVQLQYTRGVGAGRAIKPLAAWKNGNFSVDIVGGFGSAAAEYLKADALHPIAELPAFASVDDSLKDANGFWAGAQLAHWCMAYNIDKVNKTELPDSWLELVKPGNALINGRVGMGSHAHLWLISLWGALGENTMEETFLPGIFENLKPQLRKEGINGLMKFAAAGEFDVSIPAAAYRVAIQVKNGLPLALHCPSPVPRVFTMTGIFRDTPRINSALLFENWLLSKEGQLAQLSAVGVAPTHKELQSVEFFAYGNELAQKPIALRSLDLVSEELPKLYKAWKVFWKENNGPVKK